MRPLELTDLPNIVVLISFNKYFFSPGSCTDYVQLGEPETEIHNLSPIAEIHKTFKSLHIVSVCIQNNFFSNFMAFRRRRPSHEFRARI